MKRIINLTIVFFLLLSLCGCRDYFELRKPSLILQYYQGPYQWAGIELGKTTVEETKNILLNLEGIDDTSYTEGSRFHFVDSAVFINFQKVYRESSLSVWFVDDKAQVIEFFGNILTLEEIQTQLGEVEKFVAYMHHYERILVYYDGLSFNAGYIIVGGPQHELVNDDLEVVTIDENSIFSIYLIHPDFFDEYYYKGSDYWNYLFEEGGFQDWHGYGEYEVQRPDFLN